MAINLDKERLVPAVMALGAIFVLAGIALVAMQPTREVVNPTANTASLVSPSRAAKTAQAALIEAANRHNVSPQLLLTISWFETIRSYDRKKRPRRKNGTPIGSAIGLCQFIEKTRVLYGLPREDRAMLRTSDVQQADACARLLADNKRVLLASLARVPEDGELYLAHFLGAKKAVQIIKAKPEMLISSLTSKLARKNNGILRRKKTAGILRTWAEHKMAEGRKRVAVYVKRAPSVAGWRAIKTDEEFFATGDSELWVNQN